MRRPCHLAHRVFVALEELERAGGLSDVEGADYAVDAADGEDGGPVFVPVVG